MMEDTVLKLANQLGIIVTDIHEIFAEAIAGIAVISYTTFLMFLILAYIGIRINVHIRIKLNSKCLDNGDCNTWQDFDSYGVICVAIWSIISTMVAFIISLATFECITHVLYPEYYAIREMLYILK